MNSTMKAALELGTHPRSLPARLPGGLTPDDALRIATAIRAAHADSTRAQYAGTWRRWERWCAVRGVPAMPADPTALCAVTGARDAAIILIGFASALRRSELAALTLADVEHKPGGLILIIRRSKTDQERASQTVAVAHGQHAATDPVAALSSWLARRGTDPGPLFTSVRGRAATLDPISGDAIARMLRRKAGAAGLSTERITAHSLRAGHATTAALAGVSLDRIAAQTRHRRLATLVERYIRPAHALQVTSSRDLGL